MEVVDIFSTERNDIYKFSLYSISKSGVNSSLSQPITVTGNHGSYLYLMHQIKILGGITFYVKNLIDVDDLCLLD